MRRPWYRTHIGLDGYPTDPNRPFNRPHQALSVAISRNSESAGDPRMCAGSDLLQDASLNKVSLGFRNAIANAIIAGYGQATWAFTPEQRHSHLRNFAGHARGAIHMAGSHHAESGDPDEVAGRLLALDHRARSR